MKKVTEYRVVDHGVEHSQYFQGHGLSFSKFQDCATGIGDSFAEALDDALENLAQNDWDTSDLENRIKSEYGVFPTHCAHDDCEQDDAHDMCEKWYYVSVDVK